MSEVRPTLSWLQPARWQSSAIWLNLRILAFTMAAVMIGPLVVTAAIIVVASPSAASSSLATSNTSPYTAQLQNQPQTGGMNFVGLTTWVKPNDEVTLQLRLDDISPESRLVVNLHGRLPMRARVASTIEGNNLGRVVRQVENSKVTELETDAQGNVSIRFKVRSGVGDTQAILLTQDGVYPLEIQLRDETGQVTESFVVHFVRLPNNEVNPLSVVLVQPLRFEPVLDQNGEGHLSSATEAELRLVTELYRANSDLSVTFQVTPETLVGLRSSNDPDRTELFDELANLLSTNTVTAATFVEVDVDALVQAGLRDGLGSQLALGASTLMTLMGVNNESGTWVADSDLRPAGLDELAKRGVSRLIVSSDSLEGERPEILVQPFDLATPSGGRLQALATDEVLQSYLEPGLNPALAAQHFTADMAAIWFERPAYNRAVAVVLPSGTAGLALLAELLPQFQQTPILSPTDMRGALENADPAAADGIDAKVENPSERLVLALKDASSSSNLNGFSTSLNQAQSYLASHHLVFGQSALSRLHEEQQIATSMAKSFTPTERQSYLAALVEAARANLELLAVPDAGAVTLASREGVIPLSVFNYSGQPAKVQLSLESDKLVFQDGNVMELTLTDEITALEIPVRARASGAFPMQVRLATPDGEITLGSFRYTVRSTAVSGVGVGIAVAALVTIGFWWRKTTVKARKAAES